MALTCPVINTRLDLERAHNRYVSSSFCAFDLFPLRPGQRTPIDQGETSVPITVYTGTDNVFVCASHHYAGQPSTHLSKIDIRSKKRSKDLLAFN